MPVGSDVREAARILKNGGLVAFPTETVYGLGALATDPKALERVFALKGRPKNHPLILHIESVNSLHHWVGLVPDVGQFLAQRFWPGPLTMIFEKSARVPPELTGGQSSVGVRVPRHPMALALLREVGTGIAAPSANRFTKLSPTRSAHVEQEFGDSIEYILEGGASEVGLESTIVDVRTRPVTILRPGGVTKEELEAALGEEAPAAVPLGSRVPGQHPVHYAPEAEVVLAEPSALAETAESIVTTGRKVGVLVAGDWLSLPASLKVVTRTLPEDPRLLARELYAALRELDVQVDVIVTTLPEERELGVAIGDRLKKAAARRL